jgi:Flp pilus assembly protein TadD
LGVELAVEDQIEEAQEQFSEAVHLRPDFDRAHVNDGLALSKLGKLDEALHEFRIALQLNPTNAVAEGNLKAVQADLEALKSGQQPR